MSSIRIVLADDHEIVRGGVRAVLAAAPGLEVVGEVADGLQVADAAERLQPDLLLLDIMMPGLNGVDAIPQVVKRAPKTRILVLSMYSAEAYVLAALRNGALGYVLKSESMETLIEAIHAVAAGKRYLCEPLTELAIEAFVNKAQAQPADAYDALTAREREVLHLAAEGYTNAQIAERLAISTRTAEVHRAHLSEKLGLKSQMELLRFAVQRGIIVLDKP